MPRQAGFQLKRSPLRTFFREWRAFLQLTQQRLADRIGTTKARVSMKERGEEGWDDAYLAALAEALGTDPASLIMRNPLDSAAPWTLLEALKPENRDKAVEYMRLLKDAEDHERGGDGQRAA